MYESKKKKIEIKIFRINITLVSSAMIEYKNITLHINKYTLLLFLQIEQSVWIPMNSCICRIRKSYSN